MKPLALLVLLAGVVCVMGFSSGPPTSVCGTLLPNHGGSPSAGNGGYLITTSIPLNSNIGYDYVAGQSYTVTLTAADSDFFRGFAVQSVSVPGGSAVGNFVPQNANQQILGCDPTTIAFTVVHNNPSDINFPSMHFIWNAPGTSGTVNFLYTVVRSRPGDYYVRLSAISEYINSLPPTTPTTTTAITTAKETTAMETTVATTPMKTTAMETTVATTLMETTATDTTAMETTVTTPTDTTAMETTVTTPTDTTAMKTTVTTPTETTAMETTAMETTVATTPMETTAVETTTTMPPPTNVPIPDTVTTPTIAPADYPLVFKTPDSCDVSDCTVYVGIAVNEGNADFLDFYIEGDATAWVAVGFSTSPDMPNSDILACNRIVGGEEVEVLDTWSGGYSNVVDNIQNTYMFSASVVNGRIFCSFGRSITGAGDGQDFDLNGDYHIIYGGSNGFTSTNSLMSHLTASPPSNPSVAVDQFNPVNVATPPPTTVTPPPTTVTPPPTTVTSPPTTVTPPPTTAAPNQIPDGVTVPTTAPADYPLVFKTPDSCDVSDCTVYVGIAVNEGNADFLDFYIEGDATAWVAVGFSTSPDMPNSDILACNRIVGGEEVEVLDTWSGGYSNVVDNIQNTYMFSASVVNGRISCSFGRSISGTGDGQDFDLNGDYHIIYGGSNGFTSTNSLMSHLTASPPSNPSVTVDQFNPVNVATPPPTTVTPPPQEIPNGVTIPSTAPADYPLVFKTPVNDCEVSDCTVYVGIAVNAGNSSFLDFYIEGDATAWVAVGFSTSPSMPDSDILACNRIAGGEEVEVLDTWSGGYSNTVDRIEDVFEFTSSVVDGRIFCSFGRSISGAGDGQDFDLNGDYYVLYGHSNGFVSSNLLVSHRIASPPSNPIISVEQFNPVTAGTPPPSTMAPGSIPDSVTMPTTAPADYPLVLKTPDSCDVSDCAIYVGIAVNEGNSSYLDFYIEGDAMAWVAVGFSTSPSMPNSDILACNRIAGGEEVEVLDTWSGGYSNVVDDVLDTFMYSSSVTNGRIICSFGRSISGAGDGQDFDLNGDYYVLYGHSNGFVSSNLLVSHRTASPPSNPIISVEQFNPVTAGTPPPSTMAPGSIPDSVTMPSTAPADYPLVFKTPDSCDVSDCTVYVGIAVNEGNSSFLDFYIEGDATAWVAVGFSTSPNMPNSDILACNRIAGGEEVEVLDTWSAGYSNDVDTAQDTFMYSSSVTNGRISCSFGRSISGTGNDQDFNLNADYYILFGGSDGLPSSQLLISHRSASPASNPTVSEGRFNVVQDSGVAGGNNFEKVKDGLIRAHGIFMLVAWLLLANIAVAFASYMRPALPNGEWFQVHRAFMIIALFLAAAGFFLIFVSQAQSRIPGIINTDSGSRVAHLVIGVIVMCLQIANPLVALFRCPPGDKKRWIFNALHGFPGIGFIAEILAFTNIGLGVAIFSTDFSGFGNLTIFWIFITYIILNVIMQAILFIMSYVLRHDMCCIRKHVLYEGPASTGSSPVVLVNMASESVNISDKKNSNAQPDVQEKPVRKDPAKGSRLRWIGISIYMAVTAGFVMTLVVLI